MDAKLAGVVTAAGLSSRMGTFKPLLPCADSTILQTAVKNLQSAGAARIIVVAGYRGDELEKLFEHTERVEVVHNPNYRDGDMLESVQVGLRRLTDAGAAFVLPGDMPAVLPQTFRAVRQRMLETRAKVVFPTLGGYPKHPPLIRSDCFPHICAFQGDGGLRAALQFFKEDTDYCEVSDLGCAMDADTPEAYRNLLDYCNSLRRK
jgi:molybdenum cofactor cytidylyltransferase